MSDNRYWYGLLQAGKKTSAVLIDRKLNTGNAATVYMFNLARGNILEYQRALVDSKLRALKDDEKDLIGALDAAYAEARRTFRPRGARVVNLPERGRGARAQAAEEEPAEEVEGAMEVEVESEEGEEEEEEEDTWAEDEGA